MKIVWTVVGRLDHATAPEAVDLPLAPRIGETVHTADGDSFLVRNVVHYPWGEDDIPGPFVYVVLVD
jgi:hypothetical protein